MKIAKLMLQAFGPFTSRDLDFGSDGKSFVLIYGPNEAGKSAALRAISDLRFGIPTQSSDNFVHVHSEMRVGGVFVDRAGREYSLVRRKGRGVTLTFNNDSEGRLVERPVPPELEAQITSGLSKDDYDSMFGLDHYRLREGGESLRKGEGEVGAALFEASAGVRSIPEVIDRLDQHARTFFMPGARGKSGVINQALKAVSERHADYRKSLVKPQQWAELYRKHESESEELARIDGRMLQLNGQLLLIQELRSVAPLLGSLDQATTVLDELKGVRLLSESASTARAGAEAGLSAAEHNLSVARDDVRRHQLAVASGTFDSRVLASAAGIERLTVSSESIDALQKESADAAVDVETETATAKYLGGQIDDSLSVEELLRSVPGAADRTEIDAILREVEHADLALAQHRRSTSRTSTDTADAVPPIMPTAEARSALRTALTGVSRSDATLKRLSALPAEIRALERALSGAIGDLGLTGVDALQSVRPVSESEIQEAASEGERSATRRQELETRIDEIATAIEAEEVRREQLLAGREAATIDQVRTARERRDAGWTLVKGTYIDDTNPSIGEYAGERPLSDAYEDAVRNADELIDEVARDTTRAAQLQATMRDVAKLESDQNRLRVQLSDLEAAQRQRDNVWNAILDQARLPRRTPKALREWQTLLDRARAVRETLQSRIDEKEQAKSTEDALKATLTLALVGTGMGSPSAEASLGTLVALAEEIEGELKRREKLIDTSAGKRVEREQQEKLWGDTERSMEDRLVKAKERLSPLCTKLYLSEGSSVPVIEARLAELDALSETAARCAVASAKKRRSDEVLGNIEKQVRAVAEECGEERPSDYRLAIDKMTRRLGEARSAERSVALAQQALASAQERERSHSEEVARQSGQISALCAAAGVADPRFLLEAEESSRRKRDAIAELDRSRTYLATASRRPLGELRTLLESYDKAQMDADETRYTQELETLRIGQAEAREQEIAARRALEAIDSSDTAAVQREDMEVALASVRTNMGPWIRSRLAHALLVEALKRFQDRAQGPMLTAASGYFNKMTGGEFLRLLSEEAEVGLVLVAERKNGARITAEKMSEGTRDQLYLALRLAALDLRRQAGVDLPLVLDDVLVTSDDGRAGLMLRTLAEFSKNNQVILFTHHHHLIDVAQRSVPDDVLALVKL